MYIKNQTIIKRLDVPAMQETLNSNLWCKCKPFAEHRVFTDLTEYQKYIRNIDLYSFLGIPAYTKFECPICRKPEGYVSYYDEEEVWTCRCFAEKKTRNIIGIVQSIAGCSYSQAVEFINQSYNFSLKEDTQLNRAIEHNIRVLSDDSFKDKYPCTVKFLGTYYPLLRTFYQYLPTLHNEHLQTEDGREVVILTTQEMRKLLSVGQEKARMFLRWLALLSIIDATPKRDLNSKSKAHMEQIRGDDRREYASMFHIKLLDCELLSICEARAERLLPLRLTKTNTSLKTIRAITSEFPEYYEIVSPNYSVWKRGAANYAAEEAIQVYSGLLMKGIAEQGYMREQDLPLFVRLQRAKKSGDTFTIPVFWREIRSAVINGCDCSAVPSNRDQLKLLGITEKVSGILIVPNETVYSYESNVGAVLNDIALHGYALTASYLPITQNHRKQFRDMLSACGVEAVRLNDALRAEYKIIDAEPYTEIFIVCKEGTVG